MDEHEDALFGMAVNVFDFSPSQDQCLSACLRAFDLNEKLLAVSLTGVVVGFEFGCVPEILITLSNENSMSLGHCELFDRLADRGV